MMTPLGLVEAVNLTGGSVDEQGKDDLNYVSPVR